MSRSVTRLCVFLQAWLLAGMALAGDTPTPPSSRAAVAIRATQVTLAIERQGLSRTFQGTVLAIKDDVLTVLTAARVLDGDEEGLPSQLLLDVGTIEGVVLSVARNPAYGTDPTRPTAQGMTRFIGLGYYNRYRVNGKEVLRAPYRNHTYLHKSESHGPTNREVPGPDNAIVRCWFPTRSGPRNVRAVDPWPSWALRHRCPHR